MSADADFTMTTASLLKAAENYEACPTFHTERDGSRHYCTECNQSESAHIIVALRTALKLTITISATSQEGRVLTRNTDGSVLVKGTP